MALPHVAVGAGVVYECSRASRPSKVAARAIEVGWGRFPLGGGNDGFWGERDGKRGEDGAGVGCCSWRDTPVRARGRLRGKRGYDGVVGTGMTERGRGGVSGGSEDGEGVGGAAGAADDAEGAEHELEFVAVVAVAGVGEVFELHVVD